ncbi:MAG: pantetheine-phosphate adenylyltransferase [Armatimonadota bacterium]|nr:pantetheine-phosphate adenylyltransferase [Armatimonadota bacterium]
MMIAIYPGSFDPVTCGHLDIIERATGVFDHVIVAVARNLEKQPLFTVEERMELLRQACGHLKNVSVDCFDGLTVDYAREKGAKVLIRSLRAVSDFEYELQMALMNKRLNPDVETLFMMTSAEYSFLSSSLVKELAYLGTSVNGLVPKCVEEKLLAKLRMSRAGG